MNLTDALSRVGFGNQYYPSVDSIDEGWGQDRSGIPIGEIFSGERLGQLRRYYPDYVPQQVVACVNDPKTGLSFPVVRLEINDSNKLRYIMLDSEDYAYVVLPENDGMDCSITASAMTKVISPVVPHQLRVGDRGYGGDETLVISSEVTDENGENKLRLIPITPINTPEVLAMLIKSKSVESYQKILKIFNLQSELTPPQESVLIEVIKQTAGSSNTARFFTQMIKVDKRGFGWVFLDEVENVQFVKEEEIPINRRRVRSLRQSYNYFSPHKRFAVELGHSDDGQTSPDTYACRLVEISRLNTKQLKQVLRLIV